ncbi:hypothetical protein RJ639_015034 [Escallonia herrerae]|uniref:protein-serine/threonine phosphatase n=1 Tax=Escallonia herrerae TaxID=1293975 RepID=A0AA88VG00_9ASTE|nr:hypothetical protein RJ639_015034 [Escallonia herrerae]
MARRSSSSPTVLKRKRPARLDILVASLSFGGGGLVTLLSADMQRKDVVEVEGDGYSVYCKRGRREFMEDRFSAAVNVHGDPKQAFFGVFDGHGGAKAAEFAAHNLEKEILSEVESEASEKVSTEFGEFGDNDVTKKGKIKGFIKVVQLASGLAQRLDPFSPEANRVSPQGVTFESNPSLVIGDPMKKGVLFRHALMINVQNPIVIDQNYCPKLPWSGMTLPRILFTYTDYTRLNVKYMLIGMVSGVKVRDVTYLDIHGTSATQVAVKFDCSRNNPRSGIRLEDLKLKYQNQPAAASCVNARGASSGLVEPTSCL